MVLTAAFAAGQVVRQIHADRKAVAALDAVNQDFHLSHLLHRHVNGGQHGGEILGRIDIIDTDDGDILRNPASRFLNGSHGSDGRHIIAAEEGGDIDAPVNQLPGAAVAAFR